MLVALTVLAYGCTAGNAAVPETGITPLAPALSAAPAHPDAKRVLIVANGKSSDSMRIARHYLLKRGVPRANFIQVNTTSDEEITRSRYLTEIEGPVRAAVAKDPGIDFVVLTKGVPIRLSDYGKDGGYSVDAMLAAHALPQVPLQELNETEIRKVISPYFNRNEPFSRAKFGMLLVTRLDGYDADQAIALVDRAGQAKAWKGPFFFDEAGNRRAESYAEMQQLLGRANQALKAKGFTSSVEVTDTFVAPAEKLAGYASWGSNDGAFSEETYRKIRFLPGALVETYVSTSGRTFSRTTGGQSLIADLIESGVTGVKGYVSEPYTFALARPDVLFDRYTSGHNLAESFYMASPMLKWKDVVIGDPICRPYPKKR